MTDEEYKQQYKKLSEKFDAKAEVLANKYLKSTFPYKVGDVIKCSFGKVRIITMKKIRQTYFNDGLPYYLVGIEILEKDGTSREMRGTNMVYSYLIK